MLHVLVSSTIAKEIDTERRRMRKGVGDPEGTGSQPHPSIGTLALIWTEKWTGNRMTSGLR